MKTGDVGYRRTKSSDLLEVFRLVMESFNHLRQRSGMPLIEVSITAPDPLMVHLLKTDPAGSFVAEDRKGKIVGTSMSLIRDDEWYLGYLFVHPSWQSRGIGGKLLRKALDYGARHRCRKRALVTFAYNPQAIALYSSFGMTPLSAILAMTRPKDSTNEPRQIAPELDLRWEVATDERFINRLTAIDRRARLIARPEEHFYWLNDSYHKVIVFRDGRKLAGYSVVSSKRGIIGPMAATHSRYLISILALTTNYAAIAHPEGQTAFVPGEQSQAIQLLLNAGFRVGETNLLMATEQISDRRLYVPGALAHY